MSPMMRAGIEVTKPDAGVMHTSPATRPVATPRMLALPRWSHSTSAQESAAEAAQMWVTVKAEAAKAPESRPLPPLNPNHPNQRIPAPSTVRTRLLGRIGCAGYPRRLPMRRQKISAEIPDEICTTVPPAKSNAPVPTVLFSQESGVPAGVLQRRPFPHTQ